MDPNDSLDGNIHTQQCLRVHGYKDETEDPTSVSGSVQPQFTA